MDNNNLKEEILNLEKLKTLSETEGGQYLIEMAQKTAINTIHNLASNYQTLDRDSMVSLCAKINENLGIIELLTGVNDKIENIRELFKEK